MVFLFLVFVFWFIVCVGIVDEEKLWGGCIYWWFGFGDLCLLGWREWCWSNKWGKEGRRGVGSNWKVCVCVFFYSVLCFVGCVGFWMCFLVGLMRLLVNWDSVVFWKEMRLDWCSWCVWNVELGEGKLILYIWVLREKFLWVNV